MVTQSSEEEGEVEKEEEEKDDKEKENELKMCEETVLLLNTGTQNSIDGSQLQSSNLSSPNNSQEIVNSTHIQNQTTAQEIRQSEIEDKNVQQIQNVHHTEKKLDSTGIDVGFANYHVLHINKFTIFIKKQSNESM